jgi:L-serine deaminase
MADLFADEDFPFPAVRELRAHGHDVVTTVEAGLAGVGTEDADILRTS